MTNIDFGDCKLVSCVKNWERGYVRFKFYNKESDKDIFVNISVEEYYIIKGIREWICDKCYKKCY